MEEVRRNLGLRVDLDRSAIDRRLDLMNSALPDALARGAG